MSATDSGTFNWVVTVRTKDGEKELKFDDPNFQQVIRVALHVWAVEQGLLRTEDWLRPMNTFFLNLSFNSTLNVAQLGVRESYLKLPYNSTLNTMGLESKNKIHPVPPQVTDHSVEALFGSVPVKSGPKFRLRPPSTPLAKPSGPKLPKGLKRTRHRHQQWAYDKMIEMCYLVKPSRANSLSKRQIGAIGNALDSLWKKRANLVDLDKFKAVWAINWRSREKETRQYVPPRPEQVVDLWETLLNEVDPNEMVRANPVSGIQDATEEEYAGMVKFLQSRRPTHGK